MDSPRSIDGLGDSLEGFEIIENVCRAFFLKQALHLGRIGQVFSDVPDVGFKITINSAHGNRRLRYVS
jgi:hypothetical protein